MGSRDWWVHGPVIRVFDSHLHHLPATHYTGICKSGTHSLSFIGNWVFVDIVNQLKHSMLLYLQRFQELVHPQLDLSGRVDSPPPYSAVYTGVDV
jgi:hypothetical protein